MFFRSIMSELHFRVSVLLPPPRRKRMAATELSKSMNEFFTKLQDDLKEAMNTMMCTKCEGKHK